MVSTSQYRQKPVSQHSKPVRDQYVADMKRLHQGKFTKGTKVLVNVRGKNVEATINKNATPQSTSLEVSINGKVMRKDLATIYGIAGDMKGVEEASPPSKLIEVAKKAQPGTPRKLLLEKQAQPKKKKPVVSEGVPKKKVKAKAKVKMTAPGMTKLPPASMMAYDVKQSIKQGKVKVKKKAPRPTTPKKKAPKLPSTPRKNKGKVVSAGTPRKNKNGSSNY